MRWQLQGSNVSFYVEVEPMPDYDKKDAAKDTGSSVKETSSAWHGARDDSGVRSGREDMSISDSSKQTISGLESDKGLSGSGSKK